MVKNNFSNYRKFGLDIWGILKNTLMLKLTKEEFKVIHKRFKKIWKNIEITKKFDWICRYFCKKYLRYRRRRLRRKRHYYYRLDKKANNYYFRYKRFRNRNKIEIIIMLMKLFYILLSYKCILKFIWRAKLKDGLFSNNYLTFLECRIIMLLYRCSLLNSIFDILKFIKFQNINIEGKYINCNNKIIKCFKLIRLRSIFKGYIYWVSFRKTWRKSLLSTIPRYIFFSYQFLFMYIFRYPKKKDLVNPFPLDVFKLTGFSSRN